MVLQLAIQAEPNKEPKAEKPNKELSWRLMGYHKHIYNHKPGECKIVDGVENGSEDILLLSNGYVIISSGLTAIVEAEPRDPKLLLFDFNNAVDGAHKLKIDGRLDELNPHGLSSWEDNSRGTIHIFVINHRQTSDTVELFQLNIKSRTLKLLRTIDKEPSIRFANDLVATGPDSFYFTNFLHYRTSRLEMRLPLGWASVGYFDGKQVSIVASDSYSFLNGINMSPDGKYLYVSHGFELEILVFERREDSSLKYIKSYPLSTVVDNIHVDNDTGDMWLGCHPVYHKVLKYLDDVSTESPSQILRVQVSGSDVTGITEVYMDDGREFSASSVAVRYGDRMLVGSVHSQMMMCDLAYI